MKNFLTVKSLPKLRLPVFTKNVIYVEHNLFQQSKWSRTIDLNTTHNFLFKSPRGVQQIGLFGRQLSNTQFPEESYELATKQLFGHLLTDLDPKRPEVLRYCSNIVPQGPSFYYLLSAKSLITNLTNKTERTMYAAPNASVKQHQLKKN